MSDVAMLALTQFYNHIDVFLMIIVRILTFFIVVPVLAGTSLPNLAKILLSVSIALMLYASGQVTGITYHHSVPGYVILIVKEVFVGFTMGFTVYIIFNITYFIGQLTDYQIGFSMVSIFDPMTQLQVPITGNMLYFIMAALLVTSGGLHVLVSALVYSYEAIPIGTQIALNNDKLFMYVVSLMADFFVIGMRMAMPVVGSLIIIDVALGILVKAVPQMNVFVVGMPIKLFAGLLVLYFTMPVFVQMFDTLFDVSYKALNNVIGGMSP